MKKCINCGEHNINYRKVKGTGDFCSLRCILNWEQKYLRGKITYQEYKKAKRE